jgi:arabinofuranosyltransferase
MSRRPTQKVSTTITLLHRIYATPVIWRTSFVVESRRYFCLLDDAMITLCYASNLAKGLGLVWCPGVDPVEGYTSPLWTFLLAGVARLELSKIATCLVIQCLGVLIVWFVALAAARLARQARYAPPVAISAAVLVLGYYNLNYFTLLGMETGLAALVMAAGVGTILVSLRTGSGSIRSMWWVAPIVLLRPEAAAFALYTAGVQFLFLKSRRWRSAVGLLIGIAIVAAYMVFRRLYFGAWVPNTYVLKLTGWPLSDRIVVGLKQLPWTLGSLGIVVILASAGMRRFLTPRTLLLVVMPVFAIAYQVYVGGDHRPLDRFVVPFTPLLFVGAAAGLERAARGARNLGVLRRRWPLRCASVAVLVFLINAINLPHATLFEVPQTILRGNRQNVQSACAINRHTDTDAVIAVGWAGAIPYFTDRTCVDILGRCDPYIAKLPARLGIRAGHNKFDHVWTLQYHQPDVIDAASIEWFRLDEVQSHYTLNHYFVDGERIPKLVRNGSPHVESGEVFGWPEVRRTFGLP